jgi:hypothetical protein
MAALVVTMGLGTLTCMYLMFSTRTSTVRKEGLFGGVFFQSKEAAGGVLHVSAGMANWVPLAIIWGILFIFLVVVHYFYRRRVSYRAHLVAKSSK